MTADPTQLARVGTSAAAEARARRDELTWVDDADLRTLERRDAAAAWALSMFFGGGGQLFTGQYALGAGLILADVLALIYLPWAYLAIGAVSSVFAFRAARAINRYVAARDAHYNASANPPAMKLVNAMEAARGPASDMPNIGAAPVSPSEALASPAPTGPAADIDIHALRERLAQLAALRHNGVITDAEYRERRLDRLSELKGVSRDQMDQVLFALIPLINEGFLSQEDVQFLKDLGG
jgi:TM2 domain-containing membrane protein YozV